MERRLAAHLEDDRVAEAVELFEVSSGENMRVRRLVETEFCEVVEAPALAGAEILFAEAHGIGVAEELVFEAEESAPGGEFFLAA